MADAADPLVVSVAGTAVENEGGDYITVTWNEPIDQTTGLDTANYAFTNNGNPIDLTFATVRYSSIDHSVTFFLPEGEELDPAFQINSTINNVADVSGNALAVAITPSGTITGDTTAPSVLNAFANLREDATGRTIDVLFDEAVDGTFTGAFANWSTSGLASVTAATVVDSQYVRLTLDQALAGGDTVDLATGLNDLANNTQNVGGNLSFAPEL